MELRVDQGFSIVLCTHNGAGRLAPTLAHLAGLAIPAGHAVELLVVDNASTDDTAAVATQTWQQLGCPFPLQVLSEARPGKGYAVETGYDAAGYSYILTVDDDNWLSPDYLQQAAELLAEHPDVGMLQGKSIGAFEAEPPAWFDELKVFFVVGSPIPTPGYFSENDYHVWGAGMVLRNDDWRYLRSLGFAFLTSKVPGKAAGEDHETAIALLLMGRRIYYSDTLRYQHYMPAQRITKENLKKNFNVWAYIMYYYFVYSTANDLSNNSSGITKYVIFRRCVKCFIESISRYTLKQYLAYWIKPNNEFYQLCIYRDHCFYKWLFKLYRNTAKDVRFLQSWMIPIFNSNSKKFKMPVNPT